MLLLRLTLVALIACSMFHVVYGVSASCDNNCNNEHWQLIVPQDHSVECYRNAASNPWYNWGGTYSDTSISGFNQYPFYELSQGLYGYAWEGSTCNLLVSCSRNCPTPVNDIDQRGANRWIYRESTSMRKCFEDCSGASSMEPGRFCWCEEPDSADFLPDTIPIVAGGGACPTKKVIRRVFKSYTVCSVGGDYLYITQTITVQDTMRPYLGIPSDLTLECGDSTSTEYTGRGTQEDRCVILNQFPDSTDVVASVPAPSQTVSTIQRTFTADDGCTTAVQRTQTITVLDTTPPVFTTVEPNAHFQCASSLITLASMATRFAATDICNPTNVVFDAAQSSLTSTVHSCVNDVTNVYVVAFADNRNNRNFHTTTWVAKDTQAPTFPSVALQDDGSFNNVACRPANPPSITPVDNCDTLSAITPTFTDTMTSQIGIYDRYITATATDLCGNSAVLERRERWTLASSIGISTAAPTLTSFTGTGVTATVSLGGCTLLASDFFVYLNPYPLQLASVTDWTCEAASPVGEIRCVYTNTITSSLTFAPTFTVPSWVALPYNLNLVIGVGSDTAQDTTPNDNTVTVSITL